MAELTKEWLKQTIAEYEANRDELPFGLDTNSAIELQAFKLALASLEAEPVAYIFKHPAGKLFWALTDESNKDQSDVIPVYAAPPVPVVPEEKPMPNPLKMYAVDAVAAIAEVRGWNSCRAAMLHGAEPVSQTYKLNELSGNSPVTPDGWISCSDRMPEDTKMLLAFSQGEIVAAYWNWVVNPIDYKKYRAFTYLSGNILDDVTHWMPLPEPPL
ncbi:DUF551 domain-containing protein [Escherichia coli]|uniref:DUF551 domain-containing protein n=1 Tax=Escherichia coli TaxID=562 RepID=UPI0007725BCA|nr:DUF551 domain-containing protein [Escherichia coli]HAI0551424.1 DUF551 domain-containing protein [Escherichia coli O25b:H4-ST131]KXG63156.1 hypothetical protein LT28_03459 [Escherichia coli]MCR6532836.1 DUF551 domain-containing protein [Escherichia coli]MCR6535471.1 DUF551 domain-containing protein [Escherichia coli]MDF1030682.1 DUF551 domain-containing protein [Escherichia coli]